MIWVAVIAAAVAFAVVLAWAVGAMLPRTGESRRVIDVAAPPERVWAVITDYRSQPTWHPNIDRVEPVGDDGRRWREHHRSGETHEFEVAETDAPRRIAWVFTEAHKLFRGTWRLALEPTASGTRITATQQGAIPHPLARALALLVGGRDIALRVYLAALREHLEP